MEIYRLLKPMLGLALFMGLLSTSAEAKTFQGFGSEVDSYIQYSAQRYRVSEAMLRGLVKMEDGWYDKISPTGATGVGQFTMGTWNWLANKPEGRAIGMRPVDRFNKGTRFDPRRNKYINTLATGLLARWHMEQFQQRGITISDANLYLAHNIGLDTFFRVLQGKPTADDIHHMRLNGMKRGMSVSHFIAYQKGRYEQNKYEANFTQTQLQQAAKKFNWVEPNNDSIEWVNPQNEQHRTDDINSLVWVNPQ